MIRKLLFFTMAGSLIAMGGTIFAIDGPNAVFGQPGSVTGWGFSVNSDVYPLLTGSQFVPASNAVGSYVDYLSSQFFFGVAGTTVVDPFDSQAQIGAGEFDIANGATLGSILFGQLQLFWDEYSLSPDDPNFDPNTDLISSGNSTLLGVSVTVGDQGTPVPTPEPGSLLMALAGLAWFARRWLTKTRKFVPMLALLAGFIPSASAFQGPTDPTPAETQALRIIRNQEGVTSGNTCHSDSDPTSVKNCCGAPGVAGCVTGLSNSDVTNNASTGLCTLPSSNKLRTELSLRILCNPPKASCDPRITNSIRSISKAGPQNVTFYFTSDIHWFRGTSWVPEDQIRHVQEMNNFPNTYLWTTTPKLNGDAVGEPVGLVIGGDYGNFASSQSLGAHRLLFEGLIDASFKYPVYLGLGNHDLTGSDNIAHDQTFGPERNFDYLTNTMSCGTHFDDVSGNYSWDWGRLHLVMLNTWAGDPKPTLQSGNLSGLAWLADDLATNIGTTGRPVIMFQHYAFDCGSFSDCDSGGFWATGEATNFLDMIRPYNVVGMFVGHTHTPSIDRIDNTGYASFTGNVLFHDDSGNPRLFDVFTNGSGGEDGHGDFITVRYTDGATPDSAPYLDVQSMHWEDGSAIAALQPSPGIGTTGSYFGGLTGCRKRLNTRYNNVTGLVTLQTSPPDVNLARLVSITNRSHFTFSQPMAVRVQSPGNVTAGYLAKPDFVDSCGQANPLTTPDGSYVLLSDAQVAALNANIPITVILQFKGDSSQASLNVALVSMTPLQGASPSSFDLKLTASDKVTNSFTIYGAAGQSFFVSAPYTPAKDVANNPIPQSWLTGATVGGLSCPPIPGCAGTFDPSGRAVISFDVDASKLAASNIAIPNAIFTVTGSSGAFGLVATVSVSVHLKAGVVIKVTTQTPSPYDPSKGPAVIVANFFGSDGTSVPTAPDATHPGGRVYLSEATLDAGGNVVSATPLTYVTYLNNAPLCGDLFNGQISGQLPGGESVVFGDVGDQGGNFGFCPSYAYPGTNPFPSNLMTFRLHHFVIQYEGDSNFAPSSSAPFDYLVEITLVNISPFDGNPQSTLAGTPFAQPMRAKVLQVANSTQSGLPVTFTAPTSGATGVFAGNVSSVTVLTDNLGIAAAPVFNANAFLGHYSVTATVQGLTTSFSMTNLPPGAPLLTATIGVKSGSTNSRIWPIKVTNSQTDAFGVAISQITLTQVAGTACVPVIQSAFPVSLGDIAGGGSATAPVSFDFSSCAATARFTAQVVVTASGNYQKATTIGNQFP